MAAGQARLWLQPKGEPVCTGQRSGTTSVTAGALRVRRARADLKKTTVRVRGVASCQQESTEGRAGHPVWCEPERARAVFWGQRERLGEAAKQPGISLQALRCLQ